MSKNVADDEQIISALLASHTIEDAARSLGISARTIFRRLDDWMFRSKLEDALEAVREARQAQALSLVDDAFSTLRQTMTDDSAPPSVRVRAAEVALSKFWSRP